MAQEQGTPQDRLGDLLRGTGRVLGAAAAAMWLLVFVLGALDPNAGAFTLETALLVVFGVSAAIGVAIAFRSEAIGGAITLVVGIALTVFALITAGRNQIVAATFTGGPFIVAGALFLTSWRRRRSLL